jgi:hypothetical protein
MACIQRSGAAQQGRVCARAALAKPQPATRSPFGSTSTEALTLLLMRW